MQFCINKNAAGEESVISSFLFPEAIIRPYFKSGKIFLWSYTIHFHY